VLRFDRLSCSNTVTPPTAAAYLGPTKPRNHVACRRARKPSAPPFQQAGLARRPKPGSHPAPGFAAAVSSNAIHPYIEPVLSGATIEDEERSILQFMQASGVPQYLYARGLCASTWENLRQQQASDSYPGVRTRPCASRRGMQATGACMDSHLNLSRLQQHFHAPRVGAFCPCMYAHVDS